MAPWPHAEKQTATHKQANESAAGAGTAGCSSSSGAGAEGPCPCKGEMSASITVSLAFTHPQVQRLRKVGREALDGRVAAALRALNRACTRAGGRAGGRALKGPHSAHSASAGPQRLLLIGRQKLLFRPPPPHPTPPHPTPPRPTPPHPTPPHPTPRCPASNALSHPPDPKDKHTRSRHTAPPTRVDGHRVRLGPLVGHRCLEVVLDVDGHLLGGVIVLHGRMEVSSLRPAVHDVPLLVNSHPLHGLAILHWGAGIKLIAQAGAPT